MYYALYLLANNLGLPYFEIAIASAGVWAIPAYKR